jgi:hypothetical protein
MYYIVLLGFVCKMLKIRIFRSVLLHSVSMLIGIVTTLSVFLSVEASQPVVCSDK